MREQSYRLGKSAMPTVGVGAVCAVLAFVSTTSCAGEENGGNSPPDSSLSVTASESMPPQLTSAPPSTPSAIETMASTTAAATSAPVAVSTDTTAAATTSGMGSGGTGGSGAGGAGIGGAGAGNVDGGAGAGGGEGGSQGSAGSDAGAPAVEAPPNLSETGLFTSRGADGELVLAEGVREFEPRYWLWSDGSDKRRYVYLPPGTQIDTQDPDHWVLPKGTKLWKSFISGDRLVETRLIERTGDGPNDFLYATYYWQQADATDAQKMGYKNLLLDAGGTTHDIPNGMMCERCHNGSAERVLGFSALQLNHDLGGVNLATLMDEGLLTEPISLDIGMPGDDEMTQEVLGYLHANCGNCHNDNPGVPIENIPAPQMYLRISIADKDKSLEEIGVYATALNQPTTASAELAIPYRIQGGSSDPLLSALHYRMTLRGVEEQMPPIGTELEDQEGIDLIKAWIESLPPPTE